MTAWIQSWLNYFLSRFKSDEARETALESRVTLLEGKVKTIMATLDDALTDIAAINTLDDSILAMLKHVQDELAAALSGTTIPADVQAKIDAVFSGLEAEKAKLSAAVTANTTTP